MKAKELREMSDEQLRLTVEEAEKILFRLRLQRQSDKLDTPSEMQKNRRIVARVKTIQTQRATAAAANG